MTSSIIFRKNKLTEIAEENSKDAPNNVREQVDGHVGVGIQKPGELRLKYVKAKAKRKYKN